jgi:hypothetical protein
MEQSGFSERLFGLFVPSNLPSSRQAPTYLSHNILPMSSQFGYLPLCG